MDPTKVSAFLLRLVFEMVGNSIGEGLRPFLVPLIVKDKNRFAVAIAVSVRAQNNDG